MGSSTPTRRKPAEQVKAEAEQIIHELMGKAETAFKHKRPGHTIPDEVKRWWLMHYRSKFYYAMDGKGCEYEGSHKALEKAAEALGEALAACTSHPLTRKDASRASFQVDCQEDSPKILVEWCN